MLCVLVSLPMTAVSWREFGYLLEIKEPGLMVVPIPAWWRFCRRAAYLPFHFFRTRERFRSTNQIK
ncbi:protein of unknown function [Methylocaldum szegediense]|uniref:Uncharacterized protein n=1 Tax=Methylocaldum szegediense TaxID=73780 RepID=A0ABN8XBR7_9GAMM|nr:protein of unknown function [Methylocaldum szegediense]